MRRARHTSSGSQSEEQAAQQQAAQSGASGTGATGPGTTAGAAATGDMPATTTGASTTGATTTSATSTGLRERSGYREQEPVGYQRGGPAPAGYEMREGGGRELGGGSAGGGVLSVLAGLLAFFAGLALVLRNTFYPTLPNYAYRLNVNSWGWILFALGILLFAAGASHLLRLPFSRAAAVGLAVLTAIGGFLALPYSPIWAVLIVLVSVAAIFGLMRGRRASL
jgi:hypothetical protein